MTLIAQVILKVKKVRL